MKAIPGKWIAYGFVLPLTVAGAMSFIMKGQPPALWFGQVALGAFTMALLMRLELPLGKEEAGK